MGPARIAMTGEVVERELMSNAISLTQLTVASSQTVGPALWLGLLADTPGFGLAGVYLLSAGLTAVGTIPVLMLPKSQTGTDARLHSPFEEIAEGVAYVAPTAISAGGGYLHRAHAAGGHALHGVFAQVHRECVRRGSVVAGNAPGGQCPRRHRHCPAGGPDAGQRPALAAAGLQLGRGGGLGVAVLAITPNHLVALPVLSSCWGCAATTFQTANMSMSLILAEPIYHGRVQSLVMIAFSAQSLVAFPLGALADQTGLREMHGYMAAATVLVVVWSVFAGRTARRQTEAARS